MAPVEPTSDSSSAQSLTLPEVIFSCGICQATVSEVYTTTESNKGFHSGSGNDDGIVTRLWIAECSHVSCGKHLEGGAAPFHPHGEKPQAPCPQCMQAGDGTPKALYGIRGLDEGEHDSSIPRTWFQCPPIRLDGSAPGMDAVRFQYMALARYSQKVHHRWKTAEKKHATAAQGLSRERKHRKQLLEDLSRARLQTINDAAALAKSQAAVKKWDARVPVINSLITAIKPMKDDLDQMRSKLSELGYDVPRKRYGFADDAQGETEESNATREPPVDGHAHVQEINGSSSSSRKRKRDQREMEFDDPHEQVLRDTQRMSSRDMMPPPPMQTQQRRELPSKPAGLSVPRMTQHQGPYNDNINPSVSQYRATEMERFSRPVESRAQDLSNATIRLRPTVVDQSYHNQQHQSQSQFVHQRPRPLATADRQEESSFGPTHRQVVEHPALASQPRWPQTFVGDDSFTHTRDGADQQYQSRQNRQPLRPIHVNGIGLQTPKRTSYVRTGPKAGLSPFRASQPTAGSISSSFFQRDADIPHITWRHGPPPTRGGDVNQTRGQRGLQLGATEKAQWLHESNSASNSQSHSGFQSQFQPSNEYGNSQSAPPVATLPYRGLSMASQASGDMRSYYNSQAYVSPSRQPLAERQHIPASRGRITLPPSKSGSQDHELSSIRGLRGGYPQRAEGFSSYQNSGYTGSRPLFSAASRRSVRR